MMTHPDPRLLDRATLIATRERHTRRIRGINRRIPGKANICAACGNPAPCAPERLLAHLDAITEADFLEPLVTEIYQRGLDEPEAAEFLRAALQSKESHP